MENTFYIYVDFPRNSTLCYSILLDSIIFCCCCFFVFFFFLFNLFYVILYFIQTPEGVYCPNRKLTKQLPTPTNAFHFTSEVLNMNAHTIGRIKVCTHANPYEIDWGMWTHLVYFLPCTTRETTFITSCFWKGGLL